MPKFRKHNYTIWKSCERFGILPPGVKLGWGENNIWSQAQLIAYSQIRDIEEVEMAQSLIPKL